MIGASRLPDRGRVVMDLPGGAEAIFHGARADDLGPDAVACANGVPCIVAGTPIDAPRGSVPMSGRAPATR